MMHYHGYGYSPVFGLFSVLGHILLVVAIIWFIVMIFRGPRMGRMRRWHMWHSHSALSILNERFAKGEINKEEYEERKKVLLG